MATYSQWTAEAAGWLGKYQLWDAWIYSGLPEEPWEIHVVNSSSSRACASLCRDCNLCDLVAFDAEWVPDLNGSNHPISVLQFAFPQTCKVYVVQLARVGKLPPAVQMMLVNPGVIKVGFGVDCKDAEKLATTGIPMSQEPWQP
ncbi:unnamed protein product [Effrenium voratum]|nr:unnamed protein product [Effrenium voratum]